MARYPWVEGFDDAVRESLDRNLDYLPGPAEKLGIFTCEEASTVTGLCELPEHIVSGNTGLNGEALGSYVKGVRAADAILSQMDKEKNNES